MTVNEKFKSTYASKFKCFLFMGTNKPVRITDAKSGLIRRLIDVSPSGNKLSVDEYNIVMSNIKFELSGIAYHCKGVFEANPNYYDTYIPVNMLGASNDFYNFILDAHYIFSKDNSTTLKASWEMYKNYCTDSNIQYPLTQRAFKEELRNYFDEFKERDAIDGVRVRNVYLGFKKDIFTNNKNDEIEEETYSIKFKDDVGSIFDDELKECKAQLANNKESPSYKWDNVKTCLKQIDTKKLHYVMVPQNHIVIDFDIPDENGNKSLDLNLKAANKWPPTYSELSKSGQGIHLHYIYTGDIKKLSRIYDDYVEIKVFNGNASLRRKLTKCNELPIREISSGLPLKKGVNMLDNNIIKNEKILRIMITKNLKKEIHQGTKPSVDFIYKILEDARCGGFSYDVTDMRNSVLSFAANSTHQADYCIKLVNKMNFKSEDPSESIQNEKGDIIFFDTEVFPNLFLVNWKIKGEGKPVVRMINPSPSEIEELLNFKLVGFNCRRYDNHMLYACLMGYTNEQLYKLSKKIISGDRQCFFGEAYNLSYTDVYDFASAPNKMSLKKYEIKLGLKHHELGLSWDEPVPEEKWILVAEYCDDDVYATEATFNYLESDWTARKILAKMAGMSVNDSTNMLSTKIVFGNNKNPQDKFNYRDLSKAVYFPESKEWSSNEDIEGFFENINEAPFEIPFDNIDEDMYNFIKDNNILPLKFKAWNNEKSILPFFPGYKYENGKSTYRGEEAGEGGFVYAEPGIHYNVALLDVASMHPNSMITECLFGPKYTGRFRDLVESRIAIKHNDTESIKNLLDGLLYEVLNEGSYSTKALGTALKTPINSAYGLTSAQFNNAFRDIRNKDNIVAKRGALFMIDLLKEVQSLGFTVAHIKTDSIKIPNATPEIIEHVIKFGKKYGYTFEHEATYEKMCLVNDAVYIARFADSAKCQKLYGYTPGDNNEKGNEWTATGTQFQVPYVFKKLFSKEPIEFKDLCETKSVSTCIYLNMNISIPNEQVKSEDMQFIGKVGSFCPMKSGYGGYLLREGINKKTGDKTYGFVNGTKGYYWLESDMTKEMNKEEYIDRTIYNKLTNDAINTIEKYGNFEEFIE